MPATKQIHVFGMQISGYPVNDSKNNIFIIVTQIQHLSGKFAIIPF